MAGNAAGPAALFVGDLSSCCTEDDLHAAFSPYGIVRHVRIQKSRDKLSGQRVSAGYGFVKMNDVETAHLAMEGVNGTCIAGRNVRVKSASHHSEDSNKQESKMSIYVKFVGCTAEAVTNESVIREVFSQFGTVEDVTIRKQFIDVRKQTKRGYAFVHFSDNMEGLQSALRVLSFFPILVHSHEQNDLKFSEKDIVPSFNQMVYSSSPSKSLNDALQVLQNDSKELISLASVAESSSLAEQILSIQTSVHGGAGGNSGVSASSHDHAYYDGGDYSLDNSQNGLSASSSLHGILPVAAALTTALTSTVTGGTAAMSPLDGSDHSYEGTANAHNLNPAGVLDGSNHSFHSHGPSHGPSPSPSPSPSHNLTGDGSIRSGEKVIGQQQHLLDLASLTLPQSRIPEHVVDELDERSNHSNRSSANVQQPYDVGHVRGPQSLSLPHRPPGLAGSAIGMSSVSGASVNANASVSGAVSSRSEPLSDAHKVQHILEQIHSNEDQIRMLTMMNDKLRGDLRGFGVFESVSRSRSSSSSVGLTVPGLGQGPGSGLVSRQSYHGPGDNGLHSHDNSSHGSFVYGSNSHGGSALNSASNSSHGNSNHHGQHYFNQQNQNQQALQHHRGMQTVQAVQQAQRQQHFNVHTSMPVGYDGGGIGNSSYGIHAGNGNVVGSGVKSSSYNPTVTAMRNQSMQMQLSQGQGQSHAQVNPPPAPIPPTLRYFHG